MKKLLFILLLAGCSEEDSGPVFRIEGDYFQSRFESFVEVADYFNVTIPRDNMILRFAQDDSPNTNNSRAYKEGDQLYIDIDKDFQDTYLNSSSIEINLYQHLAHGLVGTPFRDCGLMKKINNPDEVVDYSPGYDHYANLFDPESPCLQWHKEVKQYGGNAQAYDCWY